MLEEGEALQARLRDLLEMGEGGEEEASDAKSIAARMWPLVGKYSYLNREGQATDVMYIMDEVGSRFCEVFPRRSLGLKLDKNKEEEEDDHAKDEELVKESKGAGFRCALVFHPVTNEAFTAFWPKRAVAEGEIATCDNLFHGQAARLARLQVLEGVNAAASSTEEGEEEENEEEEMIDTAHQLGLFLEREGYCDVGRINALLGLEATCGGLLPVWDISEPRLRAGFVKQLETATSTTTSSFASSSFFSSSSTAGVNAAAATSSSLAFLVKFFLMGMAVPRAELLQMFPDHDLLQRLEDLGLLFAEGQDDDDSNDDPTTTNSSSSSSSITRVKSLVQITPVPFRSAGCSSGYGCGLFLTDFAQVGNGGGGFDPVMYVGPDSLGLVGAMPSYAAATAAAAAAAAAAAVAAGAGESDGKESGQSSYITMSLPRRILDVCAGCGVQGIVAALRAQQHQQQQQQQQESIIEEVTLLELNPRAVRFATFNAALNYLQTQITVLQTDVRTVTPADLPLPVYDIVLSNPPYIPNPERRARQLHQYGDGGATGEVITQGVVALAAQVLSHKKNEKGGEGWLYLVGNLVNVDTLPERVLKWWGDGLRFQGEQQEQQEQQQQQQLEVKAFHGLKWSPAVYAALIHNHRLEDTAVALVRDAAVGRYKEALETAGVRDVTNGLVFVQCREVKEEEEVVCVSKSNSSSSSSCKKAVVGLHEQLWQVLAMYKDPEASEARRKLAEGWM